MAQLATHPALKNIRWQYLIVDHAVRLIHTASEWKGEREVQGRERNGTREGGRERGGGRRGRGRGKGERGEGRERGEGSERNKRKGGRERN